MFKIEIKTDGAAFRDPFLGEEDDAMEVAEIRRLIENVSCELESGKSSGAIFDVNGNKVGSWSR